MNAGLTQRRLWMRGVLPRVMVPLLERGRPAGGEVKAPYRQHFLLNILLLLLWSILLVGCNDFAKMGSDAKLTTARQPGTSECLTPSIWREITMQPLGNATAILSTMWRDGRLYYQFSINATQVIKDAVGHPVRQTVDGNLVRFVTPEFNIMLLDPKGFKLAQIKLPVAELVQELGSNESEGKYFVASDSIECSHEVYCGLWDWNLEWTLVGARL